MMRGLAGLARQGAPLQLGCTSSLLQELADLAARLGSNSTASTSTPFVDAPSIDGRRGYAAPKKGGGAKAPPPPPAKKPKPVDDEFTAPAILRPRARCRPRHNKALAKLSEEQRSLLANFRQPDQFESSDKPLRHFKQLTLPLNEADVVALMHEGISDIANENVMVAPFVFSDLFQSAHSAAQYIGDCLESGFSWKQIEGFLNQCLAAEPDGIVQGMKVQIKGRLGKKADKASKRMWEYGLTSVSTFDDHVDNAEYAAQTRAGVIGVQVWLIYKASAVQPNDFVGPTAAPVSIAGVLARERSGAKPHTATTAWWATLRHPATAS